MSGLILFEDDHLLVVNKPAGINTHKPDAFTPDGLHEWLTKREPRWAKLAVLHRLDKETSGVMVFGKTTRANQSLTRQFATHAVQKRYLLLSAHRPRRVRFQAKSNRAKSGEEETDFEFLQPHGEFFLVEARPLTGKTHQIRRQAAENHFAIAGDETYGGVPAARLMLHARSISFAHPVTGEPVTFAASVPAAFETPDALVAALDVRELLFDEQTNAYRLFTAADVVVDSYAGNLLVQWQTDPVVGAAAPPRFPTGPAGRGGDAAPTNRDGFIAHLAHVSSPVATYEQVCTKQKRTPPRLVSGAAVPDRFPICENGLTYLVNLGDGLSTGIFLDQRENRRRLLLMPLAGQTVLNCFAYTCAFSVAAAQAGAVTTSVDLSRNYLDWGAANFRANHLDPAAHDFIAGDVFDWLGRFAKRGRTWDLVLLDPPTFSTTKKGRGRAFQAERDYGELAAQAARLVAPGGWLFCSTNQRTFAPAAFAETIAAAARDSGRMIKALEFATLPLDFRVVAGEQPYLKTFWARLD